MSSPKIVPMGDHVLVIDQLNATTIGDIELPENTKQKDMLFGLVISVGEEVHTVGPQDTVMYGPYAGKEVVLNGVVFRIMKLGQIEGKIQNE